jgi:hypothetical protein
MGTFAKTCAGELWLHATTTARLSDTLRQEALLELRSDTRDVAAHVLLCGGEGGGGGGGVEQSAPVHPSMQSHTNDQ